MAQRKIQLISTDGHGFRPPCYAQLQAYTGPIFHEEFDLPHPLAIFNHSWGMVLDAFEKTIVALDITQKSSNLSPGGPESENLLSTFKNLLYVSMEFIENIEGNISKAYAGKNKSLDIAGASSLRKTISIPCNKLKHNHNRLTYYEALETTLKVSGFAICHVHKNVLRPNPEIHKNSRGVSFNVALRKILAVLYLYAADTGNKLNAISPIINQQQVESDQPSISVINKISKLPFFAMPFETSRDMPKIIFDTRHLSISDSDGEIWPMPKNTRMTATFNGDGYTRSFSVP